VSAGCSTSVNFVEEVNELFKIYFVVRFRTGYLDHRCTVIEKITKLFIINPDACLTLTLNLFVGHGFS